MAEQDNKQNGGKIGDQRATGKAVAKKKIVIKKQPNPQNKDISDFFAKEQKEQKKPAAQPAREDVRPPVQDKGITGARPPVEKSEFPARKPYPERKPPYPPSANRGAPHAAAGGPPRGRAPERGAPPARGPHPAGRGPSDRGAPIKPRTDFSASGTPFDTMLSAIKSAAGGPVRAKQQPQQAKKFESLKEKKKEERGGKGRGEHVSKFFVKPDKRKQPVSGTTVPKSIEIMESIQVGELAKKLNLKPGDVIAKLMKMGEMVTITKTIDAETATLLAQEYGCETKVISLYDETIIEAEADTEEIRISRPPVVTIMGHVDHGKTKLLDTIRKTNVVATEAGAITQHIGAYQVATPQGKITFLDTPGHEAFTAMRARGAAVTDIVILVVAADDGVKEQTLEAITHAREASIPIIVAVNKIDLPAANIDRIKQELSNHGLQPEDWGGQTIYCEISAKENIGIEHLLEMILLQAEVLDLKANSTIRAIGRVIEAKIDPGKGPVATVLIQKGILREGDPYVVGVFSGRVRTMLDDFGRRLTEAGPATPVEITGIDGVPHAGDPFQVVVNEKYGREIAERRQHYKQITESAKRVQPTLGDLRTWITDHKELKVIIKADVQGSVEAIRDGLNKLTGEDVKVRVIHGATGAISETDVTLASASNAIIVGFQTRATPRAADLADENHVEIKYYSVIYDVIDEVRLAMEGLLEPDKVEEITGRAEIRQIFKISRAGNVAGCMVIKGKIRRNQKIRLIRENVVVYTGSLKSLRRVKDEVSEVAEGFECGIAIDGYNDIRIGDLIEFFDIKEVARKLQA